MATKQLKDYVRELESRIRERGASPAVMTAYAHACDTAFLVERDIEYGKAMAARIKKIIEDYVRRNTGSDVWRLDRYCHETGEQYDIMEAYWKILLNEAKVRNLDSYLLYLERYRDPEERFYLPRRDKFLKHGYIQGLQDLIDDKLDILSISSVPGSGKTTLGEMFMSGFMGWNPNLANLFSSHSGHVTRMVYDVMCNIIGTDLREGSVPEYTWSEIFPDVNIEKTNANEQEINLGRFKPFKTLTCRALGASQTGVTRCEGILYCDDLCSGIEMALSKVRLDKLWSMYGSDLKTRKKKGRYGKKCKELHIATRWSVWDVIGRLQRQYEGNARCRFIAVPDIDPESGESNFEYSFGVGFDVEYFEDMQKTLDNVTYECLYKNKPVEREGLLYRPDSLRRYGGLPERQPDAIWGFCDTKDTGTDYNCLGVFNQYGQDFYLIAVVFRNIDPLMLDELNARCLVDNGVQIAEFESNKEGSRTADKVQTLVREMGGSTVIQKKYSTVNKETKIIVNSPWVLTNVLFPFPESPEYPDGYRANSEMGQFMAHLCAYSQLSKNKDDDAPDMVSMLAVHQNPILGGVSKVEAATNPFRSGGRR